MITPPDSELDLEALERLEREAFVAPWTYSRWCIDCPTCDRGDEDECADPNCDGSETECVTIEAPEAYPDGQIVAQVSATDASRIEVPGLLCLADKQGEFICALRNAAPALIAAAREAAQLRAELTEAREGWERTAEQCGNLHSELYATKQQLANAAQCTHEQAAEMLLIHEVLAPYKTASGSYLDAAQRLEAQAQNAEAKLAEARRERDGARDRATKIEDCARAMINDIRADGCGYPLWADAAIRDLEALAHRGGEREPDAEG